MAHLGVGHLEAELRQAVGKQGMHRLEDVEHIIRVGQLHKQGVDHVSNKHPGVFDAVLEVRWQVPRISNLQVADHFVDARLGLDDVLLEAPPVLLDPVPLFARSLPHLLLLLRAANEAVNVSHEALVDACRLVEAALHGALPPVLAHAPLFAAWFSPASTLELAGCTHTDAPGDEAAQEARHDQGEKLPLAHFCSLVARRKVARSHLVEEGLQTLRPKLLRCPVKPGKGVGVGVEQMPEQKGVLDLFRAKQRGIVAFVCIVILRLHLAALVLVAVVEVGEVLEDVLLDARQLRPRRSKWRAIHRQCAQLLEVARLVLHAHLHQRLEEIVSLFGVERRPGARRLLAQISSVNFSLFLFLSLCSPSLSPCQPSLRVPLH